MIFFDDLEEPRLRWWAWRQKRKRKQHKEAVRRWYEQNHWPDLACYGRWIYRVPPVPRTFPSSSDEDATVGNDAGQHHD